MRCCSYALCALFVFWNIALDSFLKILKDNGMHQCDLFFQEELNIENTLLLFKRVMTVTIDKWHEYTGLFYRKVYFLIKVLNTNTCLSLVCQNLFSLVYYFYLFPFLPLLCNGDVKSNPGPKKNK